MKNCKLEVHIRNEHEHVKDYKCDVCDKGFVLKWRMLKHQDCHRGPGKKKCHFFNNRKTCPFEEIGCMFAHEASEICRFDNICDNQLCPFQHKINQHENQSKNEQKQG